MEPPTPQPATDPFPNTRWTLVQDLSAGGENAERALAELCAIYWQPVYAYARGRGLNPEDAEDLTQGFFAHLIGKHTFARANSNRGRLRCYLLNSLKHYHIDQHRHATTQKRGGSTQVASLDIAGTEAALAAELSEKENPETIFDRRWALTLLDEAFTRLANEYEKLDQTHLYQHLRPLLVHGNGPGSTHADIAATLGMTPGAVQVAVHRLRKRYRRALEDTIAETVHDPAEVAAELHHVLTSLAPAR